MDFLAKLSTFLNRGFFRQGKEAHYDLKGSELRLHARYSLLMSQMMEINILPENISANICDISYGGALLEFQEADRLQIESLIGKSFDFQIKYFGSKSKGSAKAVHLQAKNRQVGIAFEHNSIDTLVFLRDILELMRIGASLTAVNRSLIKDTENNPHTMLFRGDSPTDLQYNKKNDSIEDLILSYRQGDKQLELRYTPEEISTGHPQLNEISDPLRSAIASRGVNLEILRDAISILVGFNALQKDPSVEKVILQLKARFPK